MAQNLGTSTTGLAPSVESWHLSMLNSTMIQEWIDMAYAANDGSLAFQLGIANLKHLLAAMHPDTTALLANYPNPFNPETWIPYQLAHDTNVTLTIYDIRGAVVRRVDLGHQMAGYYADRIKAAYWDGRNNLGESVGSGGFFCDSEDGYSEIIYITLSPYRNHHLQLTQAIFLIYRASTLRYAHVAPLGL